jgi:hypothetical protein
MRMPLARKRNLHWLLDLLVTAILAGPGFGHMRALLCREGRRVVKSSS